MLGVPSDKVQSHREETQAYRRHLRRRFAEQEKDGGATFRFLMPIVGLVGMFFLVVVATLVANRVYAGATPAKDGYLYRNDPNRSAYVIDFHNPNYQDSSSDEASYVDPPFLLEQSTPRIVEFYAPWCGHCQHFAPHYVKVSKQVNEELKRRYRNGELPTEQTVAFHAISVTNYPSVFNRHKDMINGFPNIFAIPSNHNITTSIKLLPVTNVTVMQALFNNTLHDEKASVRDPKRKKDDKLQKKDPKKHPIHELLSLTQAHEHHVPPKTSTIEDDGQLVMIDDAESIMIKDRFKDAITSLQYILSQEVYKESPGELNQEKQQTLKDFLILLKNTLPSGSHPHNKLWTPVHEMIQELLSAFETKVVKGEDFLVNIVSKYQLEKDRGWKWTSHCMTHKPYPMGYPCGLWQLFHVISVGVAERQPKTEAESERAVTSPMISPQSAANTVRNVVHHFFGCLECSSNFVHHYDSCGFDSCHRLLPYEDIATETISTNEGLEDDKSFWQWREFSLWLWETHNNVNERLRREDLDEDESSASDGSLHGVPPKSHPEVIWPTLMQCPKCWPDRSQVSSSYDRRAVYDFLQRSFWRPSQSTDNSISGTVRAGKQLKKKGDSSDRPWILHVLFFIMSFNMIKLLLGFPSKGRRAMARGGGLEWVKRMVSRKSTLPRRRQQPRPRQKKGLKS